MHALLPAWLALSAATLLPSTTAFYPYHYGDDSTSSSSSSSSSSSNVRLKRTPHLLSTSTSTSASNPLTLPLHRIASPLRPRQNTYNIVDSHAPTQQNSVAIDQDGGDISYMATVTIGDTSKEEYHLLLDSAASNTWVMGKECGSDACKTHDTFGEGDSGTLETTTTPFSITYGTGSVHGTLATDTLHIGSLSPALTFGLATNVTQEFRSYPMDGILGIGRGSSSGDAIPAPQIMDVLATSKLISAKLFGIHLSRNQDGLMDGELDLGSVNTERFSGELEWIDVVESTSASASGFWEINLADAGVNGKTLGLDSSRTAIIDTGTSFILMPESDALDLHKLVPGGFEQDGETFSVPCDTRDVVQFLFNTQVYNISTADWVGGKLSTGMCRSNIIGRQTFSKSQWLVGDAFLKNVYAVFDFDKERVGFGVVGVEKADAEESSSAANGQPSSTSSRGGQATQTGESAASGTGGPTAYAGSTPQEGAARSKVSSASLCGIIVVVVMVFSVCI